MSLLIVCWDSIKDASSGIRRETYEVACSSLLGVCQCTFQHQPGCLYRVLANELANSMVMYSCTMEQNIRMNRSVCLRR